MCFFLKSPFTLLVISTDIIDHIFTEKFLGLKMVIVYNILPCLNWEWIKSECIFFILSWDGKNNKYLHNYQVDSGIDKLCDLFNHFVLRVVFVCAYCYCNNISSSLSSTLCLLPPNITEKLVTRSISKTRFCLLTTLMPPWSATGEMWNHTGLPTITLHPSLQTTVPDLCH